tara:strand:- start:99 stop:404 length:306 start_codon:yes stop_codon:yes gene_type:complete
MKYDLKIGGFMAKLGPHGPKYGGGSRKGKPNKHPAFVKEALQLAFEGIGGVPALIEFAERRPEEFYKLWVKQLPQEVRASVAFSPELVAQIQEGRKRVGTK